MTDIAFDADDILRQGDEDDEPNYSGPRWRREPNLILKNTGDSAILRPYHASKAWYRARTHRFVPVTKPNPEGADKGWPKMLSTTCPEDPALSKAERLAELLKDGCPLCSCTEYMDKYEKSFKDSAAEMRYTLMVEREKVVGDGTPERGGPENVGVEGMIDKMIDIPAWDENGNAIKDKQVRVPSLVIVSGTMYQMFQSLKTLSDAMNEDIRERDYMVRKVKNPSGNGDIYQWIRLDAVPGVKPGTPHWETYDEAVRQWIPGGLKLGNLIVEKALPQFYEKFFTIGGKFVMPGSSVQSRPASSFGVSVPSTTAAPAPAAEQAVDQDKMNAMLSRVLNKQRTGSEG